MRTISLYVYEGTRAPRKQRQTKQLALQYILFTYSLKIPNPRALHINAFDWNMQNSTLYCKFHLPSNPTYHRDFEISNRVISSTPNFKLRLHRAIVAIFLFAVVHFYFRDAKSAREALGILIPNHVKMSRHIESYSYKQITDESEILKSNHMKDMCQQG